MRRSSLFTIAVALCGVIGLAGQGMAPSTAVFLSDSATALKLEATIKQLQADCPKCIQIDGTPGVFPFSQGYFARHGPIELHCAPQTAGTQQTEEPCSIPDWVKIQSDKLKEAIAGKLGSSSEVAKFQLSEPKDCPRKLFEYRAQVAAKILQ